MSAVPTTAAPAAVRISSLAIARRLALPLLFVAAVTYHALQSLGHATPTIFDDELIYEKLSQSIAAGHGLQLRGQGFFWPAVLGPLVQAPAWLIGSMPHAYAAAKLINAAVMSSAVFPAYWLARRVVRPSFALLTAAGAVATPAMVYHGFLMSDALGYPMFLFAVAVLAQALTKPSRRIALAVPAVCMLAAATRPQFLVLPLAYLVAVALCGRGSYRRHALPAGLAAMFLVAVLVIPGALGTYGGATGLRPSPAAMAHWAIVTGSLLPFALGLAIVPGAVVGLGFMLVRPRRGFEPAIAALTIACTAAFLLQSAAVSAAEAPRPLERYLFYITPLFFLAFFCYAERGGPRRLAYVSFAGAGALALSQVSLPGLTGTAAYFFDSVTMSAFARTAFHFGLPNASLLYAAVPLALALLVWALPLRRRGAPQLFAVVAIALSLAAGTQVYSTDRLVTGWTQQAFGATPPDWLDRSGLGPARYLALPTDDAFLGMNLESWNRDIRGVVLLDTTAPDRLPESVARVRIDGTLEIDRRPARAQVLVVNTAGSQIGLDGRVVARPRDGLVAYRIPAGAHVRWLARGLGPDTWAARRFTYTVWPRRPGTYRLELAVSNGIPARRVEVAAGTTRARTVTVLPGAPLRISISGPGPLRLYVHVPPGPVGARVFGVQVVSVRYVAAG
ncbi:MAG: hypothetical protein E6G64_08540 [Actinobacteria bacterium]|nr:MAG: hypothetical protein E6G64_08540 [Actinomycetota bacterium]